MVEPARQHTNPGEGVPLSTNFDGWRRVKAVLKPDPSVGDNDPRCEIMTLGDYFSAEVRGGFTVWTPDAPSRNGSHTCLMNIINRALRGHAGFRIVDSPADRRGDSSARP